jgi:integrase/recombinase XerD
VINEQIVYLNKFKTFLKFEKGLSNHSIDSYLLDLKDFLSFIDKKITDIEIEQYYSYISVLKDLGLSNKTLARRRASIRNFYQFLEEIENIHSNLNWDQLPSISYQQNIPDILSIDEMLHLIDSVQVDSLLTRRNKLMFEVLYATGMRVSELIAFSIHDISYDEQVIHIIGKGKKHRYVPIYESLVNDLNIFIQTVLPLMKKDKGNDSIFVNRFGNPLSRMGILKIIKKACLAAGITKKVSPHVFRHSYATHLLEGGANLRIVQVLLGHSSINTTQIYTNIDVQHLIETHRLYHPRK